jgi:hypothetical protein
MKDSPTLSGTRLLPALSSGKCSSCVRVGWGRPLSYALAQEDCVGKLNGYSGERGRNFTVQFKGGG